MLSLEQANRIAHAAASATLRVDGLRTTTEPATDMDGDDALRVTVVFPGSSGEQVTGDEAFNAISRIFQDLQEAGDDRLPIVVFADEDELTADADQP